jgi:hypothetical protein|uniref:hypothetical protein n=1 Tax=Prosthecobacter sp. TaxID=1965333 RepID=UPI003782F3C9
MPGIVSKTAQKESTNIAVSRAALQTLAVPRQEIARGGREHDAMFHLVFSSNTANPSGDSLISALPLRMLSVALPALRGCVSLSGKWYQGATV